MSYGIPAPVISDAGRANESAVIRGDLGDVIWNSPFNFTGAIEGDHVRLSDLTRLWTCSDRSKETSILSLKDRNDRPSLTRYVYSRLGSRTAGCGCQCKGRARW